MYAGFYPPPRPVDEVIELVGLEASARPGSASCLVASSAVSTSRSPWPGDPELMFLDEPTTGFDPSARREAWEVVREPAALGKTIVLTTHYMDEAQYLADQVAVISNGLIVAWKARWPPSGIANGPGPGSATG